MVRKVKRKPAVEKPEGPEMKTGNEEDLTEDGEKASHGQEDLESGDHGTEGDSGEEEEFEFIEGMIQIFFIFCLPGINRNMAPVAIID